MLNAKVKILAKNLPSVVLTFASILAIAGRTNDAYNFLYAGIFLQIAWILLRFCRERG
jgi:hypothetical protein